MDLQEKNVKYHGGNSIFPSLPSKILIMSGRMANPDCRHCFPPVRTYRNQRLSHLLKLQEPSVQKLQQPLPLRGFPWSQGDIVPNGARTGARNVTRHFFLVIKDHRATNPGPATRHLQPRCGGPELDKRPTLEMIDLQSIMIYIIYIYWFVFSRWYVFSRW